MNLIWKYENCNNFHKGALPSYKANLINRNTYGRSRLDSTRCPKIRTFVENIFTVVIFYHYQIKCRGEKCGRHFNRNLYSPQKAEEEDIDLTTNQTLITSLVNRFSVIDGRRKASMCITNICHYSYNK